MNSFEKLIKSVYPISKKLYIRTKFLNWGSVYWCSMTRWSMSRFISLLNFYIKVCMCVHGGQLFYVSFKNLLFHSRLWLFLNISDQGNDTRAKFILLHMKEVRRPRSGEGAARIHMSTWANFSAVNHSLGELLVWRGPGFLQEFSLTCERTITAS